MRHPCIRRRAGHSGHGYGTKTLPQYSAVCSQAEPECDSYPISRGNQCYYPNESCLPTEGVVGRESNEEATGLRGLPAGVAQLGPIDPSPGTTHTKHGNPLPTRGKASKGPDESKTRQGKWQCGPRRLVCEGNVGIKSFAWTQNPYQKFSNQNKEIYIYQESIFLNS